MKRFFLTSLFIHLFILFGMVVYTRTLTKDVTPGDSDHNAIDAFVYDTSHADRRIEQKAESNKGIALSANLKKKWVEQHDRSHVQSRAASQGTQVNNLLALLHNAIQKKQHYPDSALEMEREGRVTVKFTLFATGAVSHVSVSHSSGTESLDEAAVAAVREAAPFVGVGEYVRGAGEYSVDVVFEVG